MGINMKIGPPFGLRRREGPAILQTAGKKKPIPPQVRIGVDQKAAKNRGITHGLVYPESIPACKKQSRRCLTARLQELKVQPRTTQTDSLCIVLPFLQLFFIHY
jgi:hypothetical protein